MGQLGQLGPLMLLDLGAVWCPFWWGGRDLVECWSDEEAPGLRLSRPQGRKGKEGCW